MPQSPTKPVPKPVPGLSFGQPAETFDISQCAFSDSLNSAIALLTVFTETLACMAISGIE
jgi:predicted DNA-binding protein YlxM (UPF0122 family)